MPTHHPPALLGLAWLEIIGGATGAVIILSIVGWIAHGRYFVPNFGDGNFAAVFMIALAILLLPTPIILTTGVGILKGRMWALQLNIALFPLLLAFSLLSRVYRQPVPIAAYAVMSFVAIYILTRPDVRMYFAGIARSSAP